MTDNPRFRRSHKTPSKPLKSLIRHNNEEKGICPICKQPVPKLNLIGTHGGICSTIMRSYTYYEGGELRITKRGMETLWEIVKLNP